MIFFYFNSTNQILFIIFFFFCLLLFLIQFRYTNPFSVWVLHNDDDQFFYFSNRSVSLSIHDWCMEVKKKLLLPLFFSLLLISFYQQSTIHKMLYFFYVSVRIATSRQKKRFCWEDTLLWWHVARFFQNMLFTIKKNTIKIKNKAWKGRQKVRLHMLSFHIVIFSLTFFFVHSSLSSVFI